MTEKTPGTADAMTGEGRCGDMTIVLAALSGVLAFRVAVWKITAQAFACWILERHPDFKASDLRPALKAVLFKRFRRE